jgi:hypothetical protein
MKKLLASIRYSVAAISLLTANVLIIPLSTATVSAGGNPNAVVCPTTVGYSQEGNNCKVTICHRSDSVTNPYTNPTVDESSVDGNAGNDNGQGDHYAEHQGPVPTSASAAQALKDANIKWGDIIPPTTAQPTGLNWTTAGMAIWNNGCDYVAPTQVTPAEVTFYDVCGTDNDTFTVPAKTGVLYSHAAGTFAGNGHVSVTASADTGYALTGTTSWSHDFTDEDCPTEELTPATPAAVTFNDVCGTDNDTFTVPTTEGVDYSESAGTHAGKGSVTVTATAEQGYVLDGTSSWSHDFTNATCDPGHGGGDILGISTTTPNTPAPTQPQLANTGENPLVSAIMGLSLFVLASATALIGRRANR